MRGWILAVLLVVHVCSSVEARQLGAVSKPKSASASLKCMRVHDGLRVELVVAEPLIKDPIAIAWGADGRLWVVEMGGYPENEHEGRIRCLHDDDGDGQYDRFQLFLDRLSFPTGVIPWKKGVIVTCAPEIFYAEDRNHDGKADHREVWFTGFKPGNPQHRVNGLRWGLDNWIHCANGDSGGYIHCLRTDERVLIVGQDFRFCPRTGKLELISGMTQFGRCRDDWGNWFGCSNRWPGWHAAIDDRYLRRNPRLRPPYPKKHLMAPETGVDVFPLNRGLPRLNEPELANRITSACGNEIYRDTLLGPALAGNYFVCEPAHNLIHRTVLVQQGTSFRGERAAEELQSEFLASSDPWFRPTQVRTGPDGALWIVDMYRSIIEHPEYVSEWDRWRLDFRAGSNLGRIYRILPVGKLPRTFPRLHGIDTERLVSRLATVNGVQRDLVQQQLVECHDKGAVEPLRRLVRQGRHAATRVTALCSLDALNALDSMTLVHALADPHPHVRRRAIRLSERLLGRGDLQLEVAILDCVNDPNAQVRLQLAYSLGQWQDPRAGEALARLALQEADDPFLSAGIISSATRFSSQIFTALLANGRLTVPQADLFKTLLTYSYTEDLDADLALVLEHVAVPTGDTYQDWQLDVLADFVELLSERGASLDQLRQRSKPRLRSAIDNLEHVFEAVREMAGEVSVSTRRRVLAIRLVGSGPYQEARDIELLRQLLHSPSPIPVHQAAVQTLVHLRPKGAASLLLEQWKVRPPVVRMQILDALVSRPAWAGELLSHVRTGKIHPATITGVHRGQLILHDSPSIRRQAAELLQYVDPDRQRVIDQHMAALDLKGDKANGRTLFNKYCASCHRLRGHGRDIGPDLTTLQHRSPESLLVQILDPNRSVEPRYAVYRALTSEGKLISGIVTSTSGGSTTLVGVDGKLHTLLLTELEELQCTDGSLMPAGWEQLLSTQQDFADLLAFLGQH